MRGAQRDRMYAERPAGIIPADAGSTPVAVPLCCCFQDHPRGCGEHSEGFRHLISHTGSSPRMRGAPLALSESSVVVGIIPADTGSTMKSALHWRVSKDHPRGCGEHPLSANTEAMSVGSSPRMRGARMNFGGHEKDQRIIPADAGSTPPQRPGGVV